MTALFAQRGRIKLNFIYKNQTLLAVPNRRKIEIYYIKNYIKTLYNKNLTRRKLYKKTRVAFYIANPRFLFNNFYYFNIKTLSFLLKIVNFTRYVRRKTHKTHGIYYYAALPLLYPLNMYSITLSENHKVVLS